MRWIWIVACIGALGVSNAAATIFRCAGADGEVLFTDVACPNGRPQPTRDINTVEWTEIDAAPSTHASNRGRASSATSRKPLAEADVPLAGERRVARSSGMSAAADAAARRCAVARDRLGQGLA